MEQLNASFVTPTSTVIFSEVKQLLPINYPYLLSEIIVAIFAVVGNSLTLFVFVMDRKLRRLTNYYIASLALADLLVGVLGVPFAILTSLGLPRSLWACLIMLSFLVVLCTISIFCLVAVSIDRYWAILYPLVYSRIMTGKLARRIILLCWCLGAVVGLLPVFGWRNEERGICLFTHIMDYDFLVFLYFFTIVGPGILMSFFYAHIYSVVLKQLRHIASHEQKARQEVESTFGPDASSYLVGTVPRPSVSSPFNTKNIRRSLKGIACISSKKNDDKKSDSSEISTIGQSTTCLSKITPSTTGFQSPHTSRRSSGSPLFNSQFAKASGKEIKAAKNLSIIVVFFFFCWFPLYTINCIQAFCSECPVPAELLYFTIILSHANSAINPLLYAYHMKDFRRSLEFYVLRKLGLKRFKNNHRGSPLSPHYSTVLNVNMASNTSIAGDPSLLTPYLENSTSLPFRLFHTNRQSSTSVSQNSPCVTNIRKQPNIEKLYFISLDSGRKRPSNSTFSWPPTLLSRSLISHPSLLDSCSSISEMRKFQSVEGITGVWTPFWEVENTSQHNVSANTNLGVSFLYYKPLKSPPDKESEDESDCLLQKSFSAPPSPSAKYLTLPPSANHFLKSSDPQYQRLSLHISTFENNHISENSKNKNKIVHGCIFKSKSEKQLCK